MEKTTGKTIDGKVTEGERSLRKALEKLFKVHRGRAVLCTMPFSKLYNNTHYSKYNLIQPNMRKAV